MGAKSFALIIVVLTSIQSLANSYYATKGNQVSIQLEASYLANINFQDLQNQNVQARLRKSILKTLTYLYGPTTNRNIGGISKIENVAINFAQSTIVNNQIRIPYQ